MNITFECRYMYRVPAGSNWYVVEHYGCCTAVSMADARRHLRCNKGVEIYRVRLGVEGCEKADYGDQEYKKALFVEAKRKAGK